MKTKEIKKKRNVLATCTIVQVLSTNCVMHENGKFSRGSPPPRGGQKISNSAPKIEKKSENSKEMDEIGLFPGFLP